MALRGIFLLAWGGASLSLLIALVEIELLGFHLGHVVLYGVLLWFLQRQNKTSLLLGAAVSLVWCLVHLGLTRWVVTSAFSLWLNGRVALETNPAGPLSILLALLNISLMSDCWYLYAKQADRSWTDLKIFLASALLVMSYFLLIFWIFQPHWLYTLFTLGIF